MKATIYKQDLSKEFATDENCFIYECLNSDNDPNVSIARARVKVGETTRWHRVNGISERYYILAGRGLVEIADLPATQVHAGDTILIPASASQRIQNIGDDDLIFLAICNPRFIIEAYEDLERQQAQ